MNARDFTKGPERPQIVAFAMPMLAGNIFMQLYQMINAAIVGRFIGKEALAAVGASTPVVFMVIALVMGIGMGASVIISQYFGVKRADKVAAATDTLVIVMFFASVIVTVVGVFCSEWMLRLMLLPEHLMEMGVAYLRIFFIGSIVMFGSHMMGAVMRGVGDSRTPLYFLAAAAVINVGLDLLFIVGFGFGVEGAAWATIIAQGLTLVAGIAYVNYRPRVIRFNILRPKFDRDIFRQSLRIGLPSGLQQTFVAVGMMALMGVVNGFGTDVIAAYSAVSRLDTFVSMPVMTFAAALTSFAGQNIGAGKFIRVKRGLGATLMISTGVCVILNAVLILFGRPVLALFVDDAAVQDIGYELLVIMNSTYVIFNVMFVLNGLLRGAGATVFPMFSTLLSLWLVRLPVAILLSRHLGAAGVWWSFPIGWTVGTALSLGYYYSGRWKGKGVVRQRKIVV